MNKTAMTTTYVKTGCTARPHFRLWYMAHFLPQDYFLMPLGKTRDQGQWGKYGIHHDYVDKTAHLGVFLEKKTGAYNLKSSQFFDTEPLKHMFDNTWLSFNIHIICEDKGARGETGTTLVTGCQPSTCS